MYVRGTRLTCHIRSNTPFLIIHNLLLQYNLNATINAVMQASAGRRGMPIASNHTLLVA